MPLTYGATKRGQKTLIVNGHEFWRKRENQTGQVTWRCSKYTSLKCLSTARTAGEHIVSQPTEHNHEGNVNKILAKVAIQEMKSEMSTVMAINP